MFGSIISSPYHVSHFDAVRKQYVSIRCKIHCGLTTFRYPELRTVVFYTSSSSIQDSLQVDTRMCVEILSLIFYILKYTSIGKLLEVEFKRC